MGFLGSSGLADIDNSINTIFLLFGESNDATGNGLTLAFSLTLFFVGGCFVFSLIEIVFSLVDDEGTAKDRVNTPHSGEGISASVLGILIETSLDMLDITDTASVDIVV